MNDDTLRKKLEKRDSENLKELYSLYETVYNELGKIEDVVFSTLGLMNTLGGINGRYDNKEVQIVLDIICEHDEKIELMKVVNWYGLYHIKFGFTSPKKDQYDFISEIVSMQKLPT